MLSRIPTQPQVQVTGTFFHFGDIFNDVHLKYFMLRNIIYYILYSVLLFPIMREGDMIFALKLSCYSSSSYVWISLPGPTLVVDGMACLRHWYRCKNWVCGGQWKEYVDILRNWVEAFKSAGIRLVFIFDGVVEEKKRQEWVSHTH